jgi:hypothetical protein
MFEAPKGSPIAPCTYFLEQYELPNGVIVTGELEIEVCHYNDHCYIDSMTLDIEDENGKVVSKWYGKCSSSAILENVAKMIENSKLMDYIYEASMTAAEENNY